MPLQEYNDDQLLAQWKQGSKQAFNVLFNRYFNKLLQFTVKRINDKELAEELVMDVLFRLWQHRDNLNAENSLNAYLFRSVMNGIVDHLRKNAIQTLSLDGLVMEHPGVPSHENQLHQLELNAIYLETLTGLSPKRKRTFELSRQEGKSHKEIAAEMDISVSTVKQHINATLGVLRETMKEHTDVAFTVLLAIVSFQ
ncbi:RNA polymerase sigma-70 factor [Mucilaginibacter sp. ZT4R22]|uniref:RNA polymerase sigma-70 factor n=1 Tax=Mucilaginibacter pankratovii TaxID=2772110 RepID=A0ABR7WKG6_9SPHI|nr:RNA polymerase sigma-70 factor [Mucilaginibacter pankratovii]MBD1362661.1 RNA polymerase sigma-70 factor [Mucilaginibacter pankratovii]